MSDESLADFFFLTPEQRRDKELAREIDAARSQMASMSRMRAQETAKLRQQLSSVTGSLETRLNRLQRMFAAYVELNEIKDELATRFTDSSDQRRTAAGVLARLAAGQPVDRMTSDERYWLPDAVNAVAAIVSGGKDAEAEARARFLDPRADEFVVLAATSLGHGSAVSERLPEVLVTDGRFSPSQQLLWRAALAGDLGEVLPSLRGVVATTLRTDGWEEWVNDQASRTSSPPLGWLEVLTRPLADATEALLPQAETYIAEAKASLAPRVETAPRRRTEPEAPSSDGQDLVAATSAGTVALRAMLLEMVEEGLPEEHDLVLRLRAAKRQLADPGSPVADAPEQPPGADVTEEVRTALVTEGLPARSRRELLTWVAPLLKDRVQSLLPKPAAKPAEVPVRVAGRGVVVTAAGYDETALKSQQVTAGVGARTVVSGAAAAVLAGLAVWAGVAGNGWWVLAALCAVGLGVLTGAWWAQPRRELRVAAEERARALEQLTRAQERARALDQEHAVAAGEEAAVADLVSRRLSV